MRGGCLCSEEADGEGSYKMLAEPKQGNEYWNSRFRGRRSVSSNTAEEVAVTGMVSKQICPAGMPTLLYSYLSSSA